LSIKSRGGLKYMRKAIYVAILLVAFSVPVYASSFGDSLSGTGNWGLKVANALKGGIGLYGQSTNKFGGGVGVKGVSTGKTGKGVYGLAQRGGGGGKNIGVLGQSTSYDGKGVMGFASNPGGTTYGVYGRANSPDGWGLYTPNSAKVEGAMVAGDYNYSSVKTEYVTIPAASFFPYDSSNSYVGGTEGGFRYSTATAQGMTAPLTEIPTGATVTELNCSLYDTSASFSVDVKIVAHTHDDSSKINMAIATTSPLSNAAGDYQVSDTTITNPVIDYKNYMYTLVYGAGLNCGSSCRIKSCRIEYTVAKP
jgi:hypothetical protein